jgi:hypothetical protein
LIIFWSNTQLENGLFHGRAQYFLLKNLVLACVQMIFRIISRPIEIHSWRIPSYLAGGGVYFCTLFGVFFDFRLVFGPYARSSCRIHKFRSFTPQPFIGHFRLPKRMIFLLGMKRVFLKTTTVFFLLFQDLISMFFSGLCVLTF